MAYCFSGVSFQPKYNPLFEWCDPKDKSFNPDFNGSVVATKENYPFLFDAPLSAKLTSSHKKLFDVFHVRAMQAVSERFRFLIEHNEPGVHQFFEVELYKKDGTRFEGKYYLLNILNKVDAIIYEKSDFLKIVEGGHSYHVTASNGNPRFLDRKKILNLHLWKDQFSRNQVYMSDVLYNRYTELGMKGYDLKFSCIEE